MGLGQAPRAQLTDVGGVKQLLGPQQHPVAHLEHNVDVEFCPGFRSACAAASSSRTYHGVFVMFFINMPNLQNREHEPIYMKVSPYFADYFPCLVAMVL